MNKQPAISVVMPVYNGRKYLREAIDSVLQQSFTDFEFIIVNDGSTDDSEEIILSYKDSRINYIKQKNTGVGGALRIGCNMAIGNYIARMDADDICLANRLFLEWYLKSQSYFEEQFPLILNTIPKGMRMKSE